MSQYRIGTATFTQNSNVVTGQGTSWLSNVSAGNWIVRQGFGTTTYEAYQVASVASNTSLTLTVPYGGTTATAVAYVIAVDMLPNGIPELSNGDLETATIQNKANARLPAGLLGAAATYDVGTDANQLPRNSDLGTAAFTEASDYATSAQGGKADSAVQPSDLGTAATANVTTSATDTTAGRVLTVGAGGLLKGVERNNISDTSLADGPMFLAVPSGSTGMPSGASRGGALQIGFAGTERSQMYFDPSNQKVSVRHRYSGTVNDWYPWRELYHTGNLLGTVSQSGGVPTGAVIQRIPNTGNGEAVLFADGTMICTIERNGTSGSGINNMSIGAFGWSFYSQTETFNFPAIFANEPSVSAAVGTGHVNDGIGGLGSVETATTSSVQVTAWVQSETPRKFRLTANGRWY